MKSWLGLFGWVWLAVACDALASVPAKTQTRASTIYVATIRGSINPGAAAYFDNVVDRAATDSQASGVMLVLDTPGGLLASTRKMIQSISRSRLPVLLYVGPSGASATSAGAILLVASHAAGMSPGSNVGAAHPVGSGGEDIKGAMKEKSVNDTVALVKSLAEERGRPASVAEAMVRESRSLTAHEALDQKIIQSLSETPAQFLDAVDGLKVRVEGTGGEVILKTRGAHLIEIPMTLGQKLLHFLADPNVATLLMSLGGLLIYVEVANPGITIAGVLGAICLITGFMSFQLLPIRTGGLLLFALGLLMFILEAVVTSHGALAVGGILSLVLGIVWIMDPAAGALRIEPQVWIPTILVLSSCVLLISFAASRTQKLVEKVLKKMKGGGLAGLKGYEGTVEWVDPSHPERGRILIRGEVWAAVSLAGALSVGQKVEVERVEGFTVWVK